MLEHKNDTKKFSLNQSQSKSADQIRSIICRRNGVCISCPLLGGYQYFCAGKIRKDTARSSVPRDIRLCVGAASENEMASYQMLTKVYAHKTSKIVQKALHISCICMIRPYHATFIQ